jgi:hypothetical protein
LHQLDACFVGEGHDSCGEIFFFVIDAGVGAKFGTTRNFCR